MNRVLLFVLLLVVGKGALSQERIDTLYYSRSGVTVRNPVFADYYRLALYPADSAGLKMFKDFYIDLLVKTGAETPQKQENATL